MIGDCSLKYKPQVPNFREAPKAAWSILNCWSSSWSPKCSSFPECSSSPSFPSCSPSSSSRCSALCPSWWRRPGRMGSSTGFLFHGQNSPLSWRLTWRPLDLCRRLDHPHRGVFHIRPPGGGLVNNKDILLNLMSPMHGSNVHWLNLFFYLRDIDHHHIFAVIEESPPKKRNIFGHHARTWSSPISTLTQMVLSLGPSNASPAFGTISFLSLSMIICPTSCGFITLSMSGSFTLFVLWYSRVQIWKEKSKVLLCQI